MMFTREHAIWKFADAGDELDDWLPYAEDLVHQWSSQNANEVKLSGFDLVIASMLLEDDLLPTSARVAFSKLMLEVVHEAEDKKLTLKCLDIHPPKPGRKENRNETGNRLIAVYALIEEGMSTTQAYKVVAEEHFKSPDTIRREFERHLSKRRKQKPTGKND